MRKSFKHSFNSPAGFLPVLLLCLVIQACTVNQDQEQFENEAFTLPSNFTPTDVHGDIDEERKDPDDWRIGPMFSGAVEILYPANPNPVTFNSHFEIELWFNSSDRISGLNVLAFRDNPEQPMFILEEPGSDIDNGVFSIRLTPADFHTEGVGTEPLYRILIFDANENLITYGDVKIN